jgi:two-component system, chemotaxis family, chemotaxis protein CheY
MKHALVVDDSAVIRKITRRILENLNFQVVEAADGVAAIQACYEDMPDVIFLDWNMPEMNGLDFLKDLRQMPFGREPKVIFCTTEHEIGKIRCAIETGADEYIMKPFDEAIIKEKLEQIGVSTE